MTKIKRELAPVVKLIDVVVHVLDARAPKSTVNRDFENMFLGKTMVYVLNKADLANEIVTKAWAEHLSEDAITVSYSAQKANPKIILDAIEEAAAPIVQKYKLKGMNKTVRILVCGVPNVGKSAILNRICGTRKLKEGNKPGVTRGLQWVRVTPHLEMLDSPGLLWPKLDDERTGATIALIGSIKSEILDEEELAVYAIDMLAEVAPKLIMRRYNIEQLADTPYEVLEQICAKRGFLLKGGVKDTSRGAKTLLEEIRNGKLGRISYEIPPEERQDIDA